MVRAERGAGLSGPMRILILCMAVVSLCLGLMGCSVDQAGWTDEELEAKVLEIVEQQQPSEAEFKQRVLEILKENGSGELSGDLETQVLEVLEQNPEAIIGSVQSYQQEQQQQQARAREEQQAEAIAQVRQDVDVLVGDSPRKGADSFDLVLVEFSDFQCPFCARATSTVEQFMEEHGDEVMLVYKHLPLTNIHPQALPAAYASWAAQQQGKFWEYHDLLFENQGNLSDEYYLEAAEQLDLDIDRFNADRDSDEAEAAVNADRQIAAQLQIGGTPFFLMNGEGLSGARPYEDFVRALEAAKEAL